MARQHATEMLPAHASPTAQIQRTMGDEEECARCHGVRLCIRYREPRWRGVGACWSSRTSSRRLAAHALMRGHSPGTRRQRRWSHLFISDHLWMPEPFHSAHHLCDEPHDVRWEQSGVGYRSFPSTAGLHPSHHRLPSIAASHCRTRLLCCLC